MGKVREIRSVLFWLCLLISPFLLAGFGLRTVRGRRAQQQTLLCAQKSSDAGPGEAKTRPAVTTLNATDDVTSLDISSLILKAPQQTLLQQQQQQQQQQPLGGVDGVSDICSVSADDLDASSFGAIFRQCAPYIAQHRSSVVVIHIPGHVLLNRNTFDAISDDISIMHLLGLQIVIVVGVRDQMDAKLQQAGAQAEYYNGMRITDEETLRVLKETSGAARFEVESSLTRGFRGRSPGQQGISVVSGNFFYTAKPLGVRDGVDFKFTGEVRRIEAENIRRRLESGDVVLLTSLGYSPSGESFNVPSESLAADCAANLKAAKMIFLTEGEVLWDRRKERSVQSLRLGQAIALLDQWGFHSKSYNQVDAELGSEAAGAASGLDVDIEESPFAMESAGMVDDVRRSIVAGIGTRGEQLAPATWEVGSDDAKVANFKRLIARSVSISAT